MPSISLRTIREEHASLAAVLHSLRLMLDRGPGDQPAAFFDVMRAMLFYIDEFPERQHHPKESQWLFPKVAERSPQAAEAIAQLERDHAGGEAAVRELAARLSTGAGAIEVRVPHPLPEVPAGVASAAWFFAAEALTNAAKYAAGAQVSVVLAADRFLHVSVVDDGPGGARITEGGGLDGMRERLAALRGTLSIESDERGTVVSVFVPADAHPFFG